MIEENKIETNLIINLLQSVSYHLFYPTLVLLVSVKDDPPTLSNDLEVLATMSVETPNEKPVSRVKVVRKILE